MYFVETPRKNEKVAPLFSSNTRETTFQQVHWEWTIIY